MNMTDKETAALKAIAEEALDGISGLEPKDLHEDNFSWFNRTTISERTGFDKHTASGLMSSLEGKGLICHSDVDSEFGWVLTEEGIDVAQSIFDI